MSDRPLTATTCSRPYHCPCGCGSHGECFIYGADLEEQSPLALAYSRMANAAIGLADLGHAVQSGS